MKKSTIQKEIQLSGIGIHSGKKTDLQVRPCLKGKIVFQRIDLGNLELDLDPRKIESKNSTSLVSEQGKVQTLEHLLAALYMFGIDSALIAINGPEIPIMDGSASAFVQALREAGTRPLAEEKKPIKILKPVVIEEKGASVSVSPDSDFRITYAIEFDHPFIQRQELSLDLNLKNFVIEIAPARTFGFLKDVPGLIDQGLAAGGSLDNALVLDEKSVISGTLRFPDEFVRHKILDFVGDLSLLGAPLIGHFKAHKAGHRLHLKTIHFLLDHPEYWTFIES